MDYNQGPPATFASHTNRNRAPQQVNGNALTGETGLEGSLQHMKLQDCAYFLKTGSCAFGSKCRYNHPTTDKMQSASYSIEELPERPGQPECQFYIKTGTCKFGPSCWFHHPRPKDQSSDTASGQLQLNFLGLPLRPGERECAYFVQTGSCKFGGMCKFHHPQPFSAETAPPAPAASPPYAPPSSIAMPSMHHPTPATSPPYTLPSSVVPMHCPASAASSPYAPPRSIAMTPTSYQDRAPAWPVPRAPFIPPGPSMPRPSSGMPLVVSSRQPVPLPGSTPHMPQQQGMPPTFKGPQAVWPIESVHGNPQRPFDETAAGVHVPHPLGSRPPTSFSQGPPPSFLQGQVTFPERLGQPDCHYYMKTGDCKFGGNCKYHHPKDRAMSLPVGLNPMGLPLRPGKPSCPYYLKHRICKFGPVCKFDHPILPYSPSQSSLNEMPVAPFVPESSASRASHGFAILEEHLDDSKREKAQQLPTSSVAEGQ